MTKSFNKQTSSLAFRLQKIYDRILNYKPSLFLVGIATVAVSIFLLGGGVYDILVQPDQAWFYGGRLIAFHPYLNEQFLVGSLLVMIYATFGFTGFLLAYRSTKYAYNPRQAYIFLLIGCALLIAGYLLFENGLLAKLG
ncbi:MAG: hypothetical protein R3319_03835 [Candidatus Bathyarchaeia archaeon]|nr:hypothetical protein [Candidatus Bathyarchaeia archaeon]